MSEKTIIINSDMEEQRIVDILEGTGIEVSDIYDTKAWEGCNEAFDVAYRGINEEILSNYERDFVVLFSDVYDRELLDNYSITILENRILKYLKNSLSWQEELELKSIDVAYIIGEVGKKVDINKDQIAILDMQIRNSMNGELFWNRKEILKEFEEKAASAL